MRWCESDKMCTVAKERISNDPFVNACLKDFIFDMNKNQDSDDEGSYVNQIDKVDIDSLANIIKSQDEEIMAFLKKQNNKLIMLI